MLLNWSRKQRYADGMVSIYGTRERIPDVWDGCNSRTCAFIAGSLRLSRASHGMIGFYEREFS